MWLNDLVSNFGMSAGALTLAVAMYGACVSAENVARPEALRDIGAVLKDASWHRSVNPSQIIEEVFRLTFGEHHLSTRCICRSVAATLLMIFILTLFSMQEVVVYTNSLLSSYGFFGSLFFVLMTCLLPDYAALAKTRLLVKLIGRGSNARLLVIPMLDILLSLSISVLCMIVYIGITMAWTLRHNPTGSFEWQMLVGQLRLVYGATIDYFVASAQFPPLTLAGGYSFTLYDFSVLSTLFTSVWTVLILLSTVVIKPLAPLQRITAWFFDVDVHPIKALGVVSAGLALLTSLIWAALNALI